MTTLVTASDTAKSTASRSTAAAWPRTSRTARRARGAASGTAGSSSSSAGWALECRSRATCLMATPGPDGTVSTDARASRLEQTRPTVRRAGQRADGRLREHLDGFRAVANARLWPPGVARCRPQPGTLVIDASPGTRVAPERRALFARAPIHTRAVPPSAEPARFQPRLHRYFVPCLRGSSAPDAPMIPGTDGQLSDVGLPGWGEGASLARSKSVGWRSGKGVL
jgi:hypothetical protein